jgi:alpha-L-fucosidase 2
MDTLSHINKHDLRFNGLLTNPYEGLLIGNGDVGACATVLSNELNIVLGKNDAWDSRFDSVTEDDVLTHDDLLRYERDYGFSWKLDADDHAKHTQESIEWENKPEGLHVPYETKPSKHYYPSPKRIGYVKVQHPGYSDTTVHTRLDLVRGVLETTYTFPSGGKLLIEVFVQRDANSVRLKLTADGIIPWIRLIMGKQPDAKFRHVPIPSIQRIDDWKGIVSQIIPEAFDVPEFGWHLAGQFPDKHAEPIEEWALELRQTCRLKPGESVHFCVGIATDRDGTGASLERAMSLASGEHEQALSTHVASWREYWLRSSISLGDEELEAAWYRDMFGYGCQISEHAQYPGLQANVPPDDISPWHGYYTWNHNVQKWCLPALPTNHPEWIESYANLVEQHMDSYRYMAKLIFGLDGVFCVHGTIPFVPPHRAFINNKWGRALAMTGWVGQPLWWHWEYTRDVAWLKKRAYPYLREAAIFYWQYLEKYQGEDGDIYPSIRLEEPGWCRGFVGNRNCITDLVMFRKAFEWAAAAAEQLETDAEWVPRWREAIDRVPDIEYGIGPDNEGWVALDKDWMTEELESLKGRVKPFTAETDSFRLRTDTARQTRWGGVGYIVFPGEHVDGDEETGLAPVIKDMLSRADVAAPKFTIVKTHAITSVLPRIRLGIKEDFDKIRGLIVSHRYTSGQYSGYAAANGEYPHLYYSVNWRLPENKYACVMALTEMLLQSQSCIIRLFPFWPEHLSASFSGLRARGGFQISSQWNPDSGIGRTVIVSGAGETCRLRWKAATPPEVYCGEERIPVTLHSGIASFDTKPELIYELKPQA